MKREEKSQLMRRRIMDGALAEFSAQGYAASSVNTLCAAEGISKGILYHYFETKDDLFLACVEACFRLLTEDLLQKSQAAHGSIDAQLEAYFTARMAFFAAHPLYQRIFCEAVIAPPAHLCAQIQRCKQPFDELNAQILDHLLSQLPLRAPISKEDVIQTFGEFQNFVNARFPTSEFEAHEAACRKALNILLYGVVERKEHP